MWSEKLKVEYEVDKEVRLNFPLRQFVGVLNGME